MAGSAVASRIARRDGRPVIGGAGRRGFTLIELLVVVAVISILASMTMPMVLDAMQRGQRTACLSNHAQLGHALKLYGTNFDHFLPPFGYYHTSPTSPFMIEILAAFLNPALEHDEALLKVTRCTAWPASKQGGIHCRGIGCNFGDIFRYYSPAYLSSTMWHGPGSLQVTAIARPASTYIMMDAYTQHVYSEKHWPRDADWDGDGIHDTHHTFNTAIYNCGAPFRHGKTCNVLFADGHARSIRAREWLTSKREWDPYD